MTGKTQPFFSVIIPVYNREHTISETLESVASQEFRDFEVIVVDDGSTDSTCRVIESYSWVKLVKQSNTGPGAARNRGVAQASGKYIAFLDSDDLWFPWTLKCYRNVIAKNKQPIFIVGNHTLFSNRDDLNSIDNSAIYTRQFPDYFTAGEPMDWIGASSFVIQKDEFIQVGGFTCENVNAEDAGLAMKLGVSAGYTVVSRPIMFAYRQHCGNISTNWNKTISGTRYLIQQEAKGEYPGGKSRQRERAIIISRHVRPIAVAAARQGNIYCFMEFYLAVLFESIQSVRLRFLFGTPVLALYHFLVNLFRKNACR